MAINWVKQSCKDVAQGTLELSAGIACKIAGATCCGSPGMAEEGSRLIQKSFELIRNAHLSPAQRHHLHRTCPQADCTINSDIFERLFWNGTPPSKCKYKHISRKVPKIPMADFIHERFKIIYQSPGIPLKDINTFVLAEAHMDPQHQGDIAEFIEEYGETNAVLLLEGVKSLELADRKDSLQAHMPTEFSIETRGWDSGSISDLIRKMCPQLSEPQIEETLIMERKIVEMARKNMRMALDFKNNLDHFTEEQEKELASKLQEEGDRDKIRLQELIQRLPPEVVGILNGLDTQVLLDTLDERAEAEVATFRHLDAIGCKQKMAISGLLHALSLKGTKKLYEYAKNNKVLILLPKKAATPDMEAIVQSALNMTQP